MAAGDGLVSMTPTSIAHSGTSASINADGGVDFTAVTSLSLNGVFTSDYDNYLIVLTGNCATGTVTVRSRLRVAGTDASGSNYARQYLTAYSTTVAAARATSQAEWNASDLNSTLTSGNQVHIYGPFLAQPTALRSSAASSEGSATTVDHACTHSLSTSYDGITFFPSSNNITGNVHVFGYEE